MGHITTYRANTALSAVFGLCAMSLLWLLAFAPTSLAAPNHPRKAALDIPNLNHACGAAVDTKGDVYASSAGADEIKVYDPSHTLLTSIANTNDPCALAVTTTGNLYVTEQATGEVVRYKPTTFPFAGTPTYGPREVIDASGDAKGIAVDRYDDRLYVAAGNRITVYDSTGKLGIDEVQKVRIVEATGGTFKLKFGGQETAAIPYNATAGELQAALEALSTIGVGNVGVALESGSVNAVEFAATFTGALAHTDLALLEADASALVGSPLKAVLAEEKVKGFDGQVGQGELTDATGVAAYTYLVSAATVANPAKVDRYLFVADPAGAGADVVEIYAGQAIGALKSRREITGPGEGESFGFGPAGAHLAVDPGNRNAEGKCASIAAQACTAGHLLVYDAAHDAVEEFEAGGEYLDRFTSAALADAEPTAIAIERSGGPNDGTIYVGSGAGAGASLLAFGPLAAPSRAALGAPLSRTLATAQAVATDSHGDVYAVTGSLIHVYSPSGTELKVGPVGKGIEDPSKAIDLTVDGAGNVYVFDRNLGFEGELEVTYYTPSSYPPKNGTTYTRHEPPVALEEDFPEGKSLIRSIAVDPGPGPGKDRLFVMTADTTNVYDSAANGSALLEAGFAEGLPEGGLISIAVDGTTGTVYYGANPARISAVDATGTEVLARIGGSGGPQGILPANPFLAVDQSSGHVLAFNNGDTGTVQEFDSTGAFVSESGAFTKTITREKRIAINNSCAIQEPPLEGAACEAFDPSYGNVYVAFDDTKPGSFDLTAFGPLEYGTAPTATTGVASGLGGEGATLNGTVNPNGFELSECRFEYLTKEDYEANGDEFTGSETAECVPSAAGVGTGSAPVEVGAAVAGLDTEETYVFRLFAANKYGASEGDPAFFGLPMAVSGTALPVLYTEATLHGNVDPSGLATAYRFDYATRAAFEAQGGFEGPATQRTPEEELAPNAGLTPVSADLTGLAEATSYRFRLVATSEAGVIEGVVRDFETLSRRGAEECGNTAFRTGLSAQLPDCRAYELVTPGEMRGLVPYAAGPGSTGAGFNSWLAAQAGGRPGESFTYYTDGTLPGFEGNGNLDGYRAERAEGDHPLAGWASELVSPSYGQLPGDVKPAPLGVAASQAASIWDIDSTAYLRTGAGFESIGQGSLGDDPAALGKFVGSDGSHAIFTSDAALEPNSPPAGTTAIYDRAPGSSTSEVVSVPPAGASPPLVAQFEASDASYVGANEEGSAVLFRVGGVLYLHRQGETVEIADAPNTFAGISDDGSRVFYAASGSGSTPAALHSCNAVEGPCAGPGAHAPDQIAAEGVFVNVAPGGSDVHFSSEAALTPSGEENDNGEHAELGQLNLYGWDAETKGVRFVAQLTDPDFDGKSFAGIPTMALSSWTAAINPGTQIGRPYSPTRATADGEAFVFQSHAQLTDYDNEGMAEIYREDPGAPEGRRLLCVSCDPSGAPPGSDDLLQDIRFASGLTQTTMIANLAEGGSRVFFQSADRLLPEDANDAIDVYEWEEGGTGGCVRSSGCLALISSGQGEAPSYIYGMSPDGSDVFFRTLERLVPADALGSYSIYDARVDGGIPDPVAAAPCQGDACQGAGFDAPVLPAPATTGSGEGNEAPPRKRVRCSKGKHRVKGRCVKKPRKHQRHRAKRHGRASR